MKIKLSLLFCVCFAFLTACTGQIYKKADVIAILNGKEIKAIDIMMQYRLEDKFIENYLKEEIIICEAKKAGLSISEENIKTLKELYSSEKTDLITDFQREQAAALNMSVEEYYEIWLDTQLERSEYMQSYIFTTFGEPPTSINELDAFESEIDEHINYLFETYVNNGDLIIR